MNESTAIVKRILLPVNLDHTSLAMAKQVAELAKDHGAVLLLLHVIDTENIWRKQALSGFFCTESFVSKVNCKDALLKTWQRSLQGQYGITVSIEVCYGDWASCILSAAAAKQIDLIALTRPPKQRLWRMFTKHPVETVIRRSACQVMTLFSGAASTSNWKNIVIPVTGFIPETRIKTIYRIAKNGRVKIHLVSIHHSVDDSSSPEFSSMMDTLKMLKSTGNIQVECSFLKRSINVEHSFVEYAGRINADVLMTFKRISRSGFQNAWRTLLKPFMKLMAHKPGTLYRPTL